jgi:subtilase family serine protease
MNRMLVGAVVSAVAVFGLAQGAGAQGVEISGRVYHVAVCAHGSNGPGEARCHAHIVTDKNGNPVSPNATSGSAGPYGPSDLRGAYGLTTASASGGSGMTIAIVDAYGYNNAQSDMNTYRQHFGIPVCGSGCFTKVNQNGTQGSYPHQNSGWDEEQALDLDMVSAICPNCHILLVEASSASYGNLATAVNTAARLGAHAISNSYGGGESGSTPYESAYNHPGIAVTASTGDSGYGVQFPASSPHVTAVGGTSLYYTGTSRTESAWSGAGSGCSAVYSKPTWQTDTAVCPMRTVADVSAVADPNTGVLVFYGSNWWIFGGTSVASPLTAAVYGLNGGSVNFGQNPYLNMSSLNGVTTGSNGSCGGTYLCNAADSYSYNGHPYNGPTGLGTPNGDLAY